MGERVPPDGLGSAGPGLRAARAAVRCSVFPARSGVISSCMTFVLLVFSYLYSGRHATWFSSFSAGLVAPQSVALSPFPRIVAAAAVSASDSSHAEDSSESAAQNKAISRNASSADLPTSSGKAAEEARATPQQQRGHKTNPRGSEVAQAGDGGAVSDPRSEAKPAKKRALSIDGVRISPLKFSRHVAPDESAGEASELRPSLSSESTDAGSDSPVAPEAAATDEDESSAREPEEPPAQPPAQASGDAADDLSPLQTPVLSKPTETEGTESEVSPVPPPNASAALGSAAGGPDTELEVEWKGGASQKLSEPSELVRRRGVDSSEGATTTRSSRRSGVFGSDPDSEPEAQESKEPISHTLTADLVKAALERRVSKLVGSVEMLQRQLKGVEQDIQFYRASLHDMRPHRNVEAFEEIASGGPSFPHKSFLERLQYTVDILDSRIAAFARTNITLFDEQLSETVEQKLTPLRRDVMDLTFALMNASDSSLAMAKELADVSNSIGVTIDRTRAEVELLESRRIDVFEEALRREEYRLLNRLDELKQTEQSRINRSSLEEQILSTAVTDAVQEMDMRGFGVLDVSEVYPDSDAKKVLNVLLYLVEQHQKPSWEVLPIVVVTAPPPPLPAAPRSMKKMWKAALKAATQGPRALRQGGGFNAEDNDAIDEAGRGDVELAGLTAEAAFGLVPSAVHGREERERRTDSVARGRDRGGSETAESNSYKSRRGSRGVKSKPGEKSPGDERAARAEAQTLQAEAVAGAETRDDEAGEAGNEGLADDGFSAVDEFMNSTSGVYEDTLMAGVSEAQNEGREDGRDTVQHQQGLGPQAKRTNGSGNAPFFGELLQRAKKQFHRGRVVNEQAPEGLETSGTSFPAKQPPAKNEGSFKRSEKVVSDWGAQDIGTAEALSMSGEDADWVHVSQMLPSASIVQDAAADDRTSYGMVPPLAALQRLVYEHFQGLPTAHAPEADAGPREGERPDNKDAASSQAQSLEELGVQSSAKPEAVETASTAPEDSDFVKGDEVSPGSRADSSARGEKRRARMRGPAGRRAEKRHRKKTLRRSEGYYVMRVSGLLIESFYFSADHTVTPVPTHFPVTESVFGLGPLVPHSEFGAELSRAFAGFRWPSASLSPFHDAVGSEKGLGRGGSSRGSSADALAAGLQPAKIPPLDVVVREVERTRSAGTQLGAEESSLLRIVTTNQAADQEEGTVSDGLAVLTQVQREIGEARAKDPGAAGLEDKYGLFGRFNPFVCCLNESTEQLAKWCTSSDPVSAAGEGAAAGSAQGEPRADADPPLQLAAATRADAEGQDAAVAAPQTGDAPAFEGAEVTSGVDAGNSDSEASPVDGAVPSRPAPGVPSSSGNRKVLVIYLGSRTGGLPLRYLGGKRGELRRLHLAERSASALTQHIDSVCAADFSRRRRTAARLRETDGKGTGQKTKHPSRDSVGGRCSPLEAFVRAPLQHRVWRELMTFKQELHVANPERWAVDRDRRLLDKYQIDVETAYSPGAPPLFLPLSPFFRENVLLIRMHLGTCPARKRGRRAFAVPPVSVLERALYLVGYPAAGQAATSAFSYATKTQSRLTRLKESAKAAAAEAFPHYQPVLTAMQTATAEAGLWGRTAGAGEQSYWIADVFVKYGTTMLSSIDLIDGSLRGLQEMFLDESSSVERYWRVQAGVEGKKGRRSRASPEGRIHIRGKPAGEGEPALECDEMQDIVKHVSSLMETRVIPRLYASELRGRRIIVSLFNDDSPYEGERVFSGRELETEWDQFNMLADRT
ncbi:hypothetical protein BESB_038650 [Besnoitia besnoiti]|uniref:Uncharacterized protein n=1 Tax=Besnoitia besnoiti TaxID=94643 RepID=A0A2A9MNG3_BESBE|nr:hypothetical protein BESB_038650 [Besnoitia besnoiti]PFH37407.1 hypothetical protein BESB_038650 [Besnoitia besnoiti]